MNAAQEAISQKIFGPPSNLFFLRKELIVDLLLFCLKINKIISDQSAVRVVFNDFFINVARDIGNNSTQYAADFSDRPSIKSIHENLPPGDNKFSFQPVTQTEVYKIMLHFDIKKKSTGVDDISAKLLKSCSNSFTHAVSGLVNLSFATSTFPSSLKEAQVLPLFRKKDPLKKENHRPVIVLPTTSKVYERTIHDQLTEHCDIF